MFQESRTTWKYGFDVVSKDSLDMPSFRCIKGVPHLHPYNEQFILCILVMLNFDGMRNWNMQQLYNCSPKTVPVSRGDSCEHVRQISPRNSQLGFKCRWKALALLSTNDVASGVYVALTYFVVMKDTYISFTCWTDDNQIKHYWGHFCDYRITDVSSAPSDAVNVPCNVIRWKRSRRSLVIFETGLRIDVRSALKFRSHAQRSLYDLRTPFLDC